MPHSRLLLCLTAALAATFLPASAADPRDDDSPWGIASGAEWSGDHPRFLPLLHEAGVTWLRYFPEWQTIQPAQGQWNWKPADDLLAACKANQIRLGGVFAFAAKWATTDGSTRRVPLKDNKFWREYVAACVERYKADILYWEVWNEFNGSFSVGGTPKIYADLVKDAFTEAKKIDPKIRIGMSVANFDVGFLDAAIKAGAAGHFDYLAVHPYENLGAVMTDGGEMGFLSLANSLKKMLRDNKQPDDMPLWITEIGTQSTIQPNAQRDAEQADAIVKCYVLAIAAGFDKTFWFEARGPAYGKGTDHGIIRADWSLRPVYHALKAMTSALGAEPKYLGWLDVGPGAYGFVFQSPNGPVLVSWAPKGGEGKFSLPAGVQVKNVLGQPAAVAAKLTRSPVFVTGLPADLVAAATANEAKPFPWGTDFSKTDTAKILLGATNRDEGVSQKKPETTDVVHGLDWSARKSTNKKGGEGHYIYFRVDPTFAGFGNKNLAITVVARRDNPNTPASFSLLYEGLSGYKNPASARWEIPAGDQWVEHTWTVNDANFVGAWGWNFRTDGGGSKGEFQVKEVRVKKVGP